MKYGAKKEDIESWFAWNKDMKSMLKSKIVDLDAKVKDWTGMEHTQGYFKNDDRDSSRPYMDTCLAALQLILWKSRFFPDIPNAAAKENTGEEGSADQVIDSGDVVVEVDI